MGMQVSLVLYRSAVRPLRIMVSVGSGRAMASDGQVKCRVKMVQQCLGWAKICTGRCGVAVYQRCCLCCICMKEISKSKGSPVCLPFPITLCSCGALLTKGVTRVCEWAEGEWWWCSV
jgi:hypothetical protein